MVCERLFCKTKCDITAPQGMPMHFGEGKLTDAFNQTSVANANYGTIGPEDPTQEAYDRYVQSPYE